MSDKKIFLTFDDGPIPEITPWVLSELQSREIKATFFCVGENTIRHKDVFESVKEKGHSIGNHTMNHLNGWTAETKTYLDNVEQFEMQHATSLFRPPYGKLKASQTKLLKTKYEIVLWDVLSGDYNRKLSPDKVLSNCIKGLKPGSIIVFHDSLKAQDNLWYALPRFLDHCQNSGFEFDVL